MKITITKEEFNKLFGSFLNKFKFADGFDFEEIKYSKYDDEVHIMLKEQEKKPPLHNKLEELVKTTREEMNQVIPTSI